MKYRVGSKFNLAADALDNYRVPAGPYTVRAVYTHYCKPAQMDRDPTGHPGFDPNGGSPLYRRLRCTCRIYIKENMPHD